MNKIDANVRDTLGAAVLFAVLVALAFPSVVIGHESFYHVDRYFEHEPFWNFAARAFRAGHWPWWTHWKQNWCRNAPHPR